MPDTFAPTLDVAEFDALVLTLREAEKRGRNIAIRYDCQQYHLLPSGRFLVGVTKYIRTRYPNIDTWLAEVRSAPAQ